MASFGMVPDSELDGALVLSPERVSTISGVGCDRWERRSRSGGEEEVATDLEAVVDGVFSTDHICLTLRCRGTTTLW